MDTLNFEQIGEKLKKIRLSKNLTQEYIANAADVNTSHISNIENNRVKVSLSVLVQVDIFWNNRFVVAFHIVLRHDAIIFDSGFIEEVCGVGFLQ